MSSLILIAAILGQSHSIDFDKLPSRLRQGILQGNFPTPPRARMYRVPSRGPGISRPQSAFPDLLPINGDPEMYKSPNLLELNKFNELCLVHHNKIRRYAEAPELELRRALIRTAQEHAEYLAENQLIDHFADGSPAERAARNGWMLGLWTTSEVIAVSYKNPAHAFQGWWNSFGHKRIIVDRHWNYCGYGVARDVNGTYYWVATVGATNRRIR